MAKIEYDRWFDAKEVIESSYDKNFKDEEITFCYSGRIRTLSSGFFGRCDYFLGYITEPKYRNYYFLPGESRYRGTRACIIIGGKYDSLLIISDNNNFKLKRNIRSRHFTPPQGYFGKINKNLLGWAELFSSDHIKSAYGIKKVIICDSSFALQFQSKKGISPSTRRLIQKIKLYLKL